MRDLRDLARRLKVDGWYTCDQTHFSRIVRNLP
jgi:hypothetical protein